jgi:uncharacterized protein (DUF1330 family)
MTAYMIVNLDIHDLEGMSEYRDNVPALVAKHGGEYIVRGGEFEVMEGNWQPSRLVLFRFPNREAIHNFFDDPEYAELKALRHRTADCDIVIVDGID